jgi:carbon storage regulator CsrA
MLVLSRECDTTVWIGPNVKVKILSIQKRRVKLGIEAPAGIQVWRDELIEGSDYGRVICEETTQRALLEGSSKVLLVEDDADHARLISRTLSEVCLNSPVVAETGGAALSLLDSTDEEESGTQPRLVVLDLRLPDMSGLDVLREIRSRPELATMPVVILSAEQNDAVVTSCLQAGANAFVSKAADYEQFRNSIRRLGVFWGGECRIPSANGCDREAQPVRAK